MLESQFFNLHSLDRSDLTRVLKGDDGELFDAFPRLLWKAYVKPRGFHLLLRAVNEGHLPKDFDCHKLQGRFVSLAGLAISVPDPCSIWELNDLALRYHRDPEILRGRGKGAYWNNGMARRFADVGKLLCRIERISESRPPPTKSIEQPIHGWLQVVKDRAIEIVAYIATELAVVDKDADGSLDAMIQFLPETPKALGIAATVAALPSLAKDR